QALAVLACDLLSLTLLKTPGEMEADVAIGSAQRFGVPLGFGGPHAAFMSCRKDLQRAIPGRIIGLSKDRHGSPAYRMSLQTREQHIRREKATSNICTAQALLAIIASFYAVYFGPRGLKRIALRINALSRALAAGLQSAGYELRSSRFFDTLCVASGEKTELLLQLALEQGYNLRRIDASHLGITFDDTSKTEDVLVLLNEVFLKTANVSRRIIEVDELIHNYGVSIPQELRRQSSYLQHPVFNSKHSETQIMRYMCYLVNKDIALDRSMIPLGSCTMKLNAATEMKAVTLSGFANIHPFVPRSQSQGYRMLITELEYYLCALTGYDAVSLQPNAGSQGEYVGLLAIRAYHEAQGESRRNVCLIPTSAHGTNPASANMAGMRVVALKCDERGNIDLQDLSSQCALHAQDLACIMITYPSTHGVFEANVRQVCDIVHQAGGQVYIDGANMNAQVGLAYPGLYGGDVSHLNLHKTFAIPHGGGGPGVGPVLVKSHLERYLPGHKIVDNGRGRDGAVAAAPWGSASVLVITYAYIALLGCRGLRRASEVAILSANYIARRLEPYYSILYKGETGYVAHECILDIRPLEKETGIGCEDIAKRLMDFGIHAPTMAFPVPGTLMVEPTESEPLEELDRFVEAMICIRKEIEELHSGEYLLEDNVLKNAPHTMAEVTEDEWTHSYTRQKAAFPLSRLRHNKIWPSVARIDNVAGDRNLFCACAPPEAWQ
ncbi:MAG: aminomethyl-transferring glycine dehydrogenase, partial [Spirochaetota bacterium]